MKNFATYLIEVSMSATDALKVLGLKNNFTDDQLKAAYKKAALANHPDKGGDVTKMQQVNQARDVLLQPSTNFTNGPSSRASQTYRDAAASFHSAQSDDQNDTDHTPHPQQSNIRYMQIYEMFRRELNAEIRSKIGDGQIRVPLMKGSNSVKHKGNRVVIVISRQKNMLGTEYLVRGIFEVGKTMLKPIMKLDHSNYERTVWESGKSILWFINKLKDLRNDDHLTRNSTIAEDYKKLQTILDYYQKNQTKIDPNIK